MNHIALHRNYTKNIKGKRYVDSSKHSHEDDSTLGSHGRGSKSVSGDPSVAFHAMVIFIVPLRVL